MRGKIELDYTDVADAVRDWLSARGVSVGRDVRLWNRYTNTFTGLDEKNRVVAEVYIEPPPPTP